MTAVTFRVMLEAAIARSGVGTPAARELPEPRRGFAYVCHRCDVYGYLGPDDPQVCWSCDTAETLERR